MSTWSIDQINVNQISLSFGIFSQAVTWAVATLLITINGYLLMDFFSSEIQGPLSGSLLCVAVFIYASFVLYLILRGTELSDKIVKAIRSSFS